MVAIVKYNAGNVLSVQFALERLGINALVTDDIGALRAASRVIFPGVGEASTAMKYLRARKLDDILRSLTQPMLGICLGMQLMCDYSEEGDTECLGIFEQTVRAFKGDAKIPHTGWNQLQQLSSPIFEGIAEGENMYFVHGYYAEVGENTIATCDYIVPFSAAIQKNNFTGMQFHPEKSGDIGSKLLANFLK